MFKTELRRSVRNDGIIRVACGERGRYSSGVRCSVFNGRLAGYI